MEADTRNKVLPCLKSTDGKRKLSALDRTGLQKFPEPEIIKINPSQMSDNENLIASISNDPLTPADTCYTLVIRLATSWEPRNSV